MTEQELRSVKQVSEALGLSVRTVLRRIANGEIAATKVGGGRTNAFIISAAEVERLLAETHRRAS